MLPSTAPFWPWLSRSNMQALRDDPQTFSELNLQVERPLGLSCGIVVAKNPNGKAATVFEPSYRSTSIARDVP